MSSSSTSSSSFSSTSSHHTFLRPVCFRSRKKRPRTKVSSSLSPFFSLSQKRHLDHDSDDECQSTKRCNTTTSIHVSSSSSTSTRVQDSQTVIETRERREVSVSYSSASPTFFQKPWNMKQETLEESLQNNVRNGRPPKTGGVGDVQFDTCLNKNCDSNIEHFLARDWMIAVHEHVVCTLCGTIQSHGVFADLVWSEFKEPLPEFTIDRSKQIHCRSTATPMQEIKSAKPSVHSLNRVYLKTLSKVDRMSQTETDIMESGIANARKLFEEGMMNAYGRDKERQIAQLCCMAEQMSHTVYAPCHRRHSKSADSQLATDVFLACLLKADADSNQSEGSTKLLKPQYFNQLFYPRASVVVSYDKAEELLQEMEKHNDFLKEDG